jgi:hypothetical protein
LRRRLHELDCGPIGIANVDNALPGIRARFQDLRLANRAPTGRGNRAQHSIKIIYRKRNMHRSDIARPEIGAFSVRWRVVLEQLNLVPRRFEDSEGDLGARHSGDFAGEVTCMMRPMRKLEAEDSLPESERPFEIRDCDAGVIGRDDSKRRSAHADSSANVQRSTLNVQRSIRNGGSAASSDVDRRSQCARTTRHYL